MIKYSVGDRVVLNENFDSTRRKGFAGVVHSVNSDYLNVDFDNGREAIGMFASRFILESTTTIDVDTLGYRVEYKSGKFFIGCQTVSFEDANKVADFIKSQVKIPDLVFGKGDRLLYKASKGYIVVQPTANELVLIDLESGHRYTNPVQVTNILEPTQAQCKELMGSSSEYFTKEEKCK